MSNDFFNTFNFFQKEIEKLNASWRINVFDPIQKQQSILDKLINNGIGVDLTKNVPRFSFLDNQYLVSTNIQQGILREILHETYRPLDNLIPQLVFLQQRLNPPGISNTSKYLG